MPGSPWLISLLALLSSVQNSKSAFIGVHLRFQIFLGAFASLREIFWLRLCRARGFVVKSLALVAALPPQGLCGKNKSVQIRYIRVIRVLFLIRAYSCPFVAKISIANPPLTCLNITTKVLNLRILKI
jgi:hypothetical protein